MSGDWSSAGNWTNGEPTSSIDVHVANGGTAIVSKPDEACGNLALGGPQDGNIQVTDGALSVGGRLFVGDSGTGTFSHSGGTVTVTSAEGGICVASDYGTVGTYNLSGTGQLFARDETVSNAGVGTFNQTGGTNTVSHIIYLGYGPNKGTYIQSGGITTIAGDLFMACNMFSSAEYRLSGTGQLSATSEWVSNGYPATFVQSGGTNTVAYLRIGYDYNGGVGTGTYTLSGTGVLDATYETLAESGGVGILTQSGGINTVSNSLYLGGDSRSQATYNLNGGILCLSSIQCGAGTAAFNFGGGTVQARGSFSTKVPMTLTGTGGNANVNTAGYAMTLSGQLSGPGGLTKVGSGNLTLATANSYSGNTLVNGGSVVLGDPGACSRARWTPVAAAS